MRAILFPMTDQTNDNQIAKKADINRLENRMDRFEHSIKEEIKKLATKEEIKKFATKTELKKVERNLRGEILRVEERVEKVEDRLERVETKVDTVNEKLDKLQNTLDGFVQTVDDLRTDNQIGAHQTRELRVQIEDHEKRIKHLESTAQST